MVEFEWDQIIWEDTDSSLIWIYCLLYWTFIPIRKPFVL